MNHVFLILLSLAFLLLASVDSLRTPIENRIAMSQKSKLSSSSDADDIPRPPSSKKAKAMSESDVVDEMVAFTLATVVVRFIYLPDKYFGGNYFWSSHLVDAINALNENPESGEHSTNFSVNKVFFGHGVHTHKKSLVRFFGWIYDQKTKSEEHKLPPIRREDDQQAIAGGCVPSFLADFYSAHVATPKRSKLFEFKLAFPQKGLVNSFWDADGTLDFSSLMNMDRHSEDAISKQLALIRGLRSFLLESVMLESNPAYNELSQIATPVVFAQMIVDRVHDISSAQQHHIADLQSHAQRVLPDLRNALSLEIKAIEKAIEDMYGRTLQTLAKDDAMVNHLADKLNEAYERDVSLAPILFSIVMTLACSEKDFNDVTAQKNLDLFYGRVVTADPLETNMFKTAHRSDPNNKKLLAKMEVLRTTADLILQVIIQARRKGTLPLEWIMALTTMLKEGGAQQHVIDKMNKMHITYSSSAITDLESEGLEAFYKQRTATLREQLDSTVPRGNVLTGDTYSVRQYIPICQLDNYVVNKYAREQHEGMQFTRTVHTLTMMILPRPLHYGFLHNDDRARACTLVNTDNVTRMFGTLEVGYLDLRGALDIPPALGGGKVLDTTFTHLGDYKKLASAPAKSAAHAEQIQLFAMMLQYVNGGEKEVLFPVDPEFVLQSLNWAILYPEFFKWFIQVCPSFHTQKHCGEVLEELEVFQRLVKGSLHKYIGFKPSISENLLSNIDRANSTSGSSNISVLTKEADELVLASAAAEDAGDRSSAKGDATAIDQSTSRSSAASDSSSLSASSDRSGSLDDGDSSDSDDEEKPDGAGGEMEDEDDDPEDEETVANEFTGALARVANLPEAEAKMARKGESVVQETVNNLIPTLVSIIKRWKIQQRHEQALRDFKRLPAARKKLQLEIDKLKVSITHKNAVKAEQERMELTKTNHQRLKFGDELLYAVMMCGLEDPAVKAILYATDASAIIRLFRSLMEIQALCVEPFNNLNAKGNIEQLLTLLPMMTRLVAFGKKPKIVRAFMFLVMQNEHLVEHRPDILVQMAQNCTSLNEVFIEHLHSVVARQTNQNTVLDFDKARVAPVKADKKASANEAWRKITKTGEGGPLKKVLGPSTQTDREDSEVKRQVTRFEVGGSERLYVQHVAKYWLLPLLQKLASLPLIGEGDAATLDSYRPLAFENTFGYLTESRRQLEEHIKSLRRKEAKMVAAEMAEALAASRSAGAAGSMVGGGDGTTPVIPPIAPVAVPVEAPLNAFTFFLDKALTKETAKQTVNYLHTQPVKYKYMESDALYNKEKIRRLTLTSATKKAMVSMLESLFRVRHPDLPASAASMTDKDCMEVFKSMCSDDIVPPVALKSNVPDFDPRAPKKAAKKRTHSYKFYLDRAPDMAKTIAMFDTLAWDPQNVFPFTTLS